MKQVNHRSLLAILVSLVIVCSSSAALAQKPALVRDVDRPTAQIVTRDCAAMVGEDCVLYPLVPDNKVLVVELLSYQISMGKQDQIVTDFWVNTGLIRLFLNPVPMPKADYLFPTFAGTMPMKFYVWAGNTLRGTAYASAGAADSPAQYYMSFSGYLVDK